MIQMAMGGYNRNRLQIVSLKELLQLVAYIRHTRIDHNALAPRP
jgi:hypothetical protein